MRPSKTTIPRKIKKFLITIAWGIATRRSRGHGGQYPQPTTCRPEIYLPSHIWDSQNPVERYASVGDLCAHLGEQLPIQIVKRIARDVLRGLVVLHKTRGMAHGDLNQDCILISPLNMKTLISQFYANDEQQSQHSTAVLQSEMSHSETVVHLLNSDTAVIPGPASEDSEPIVFRLCYPEIERPRHDLLCDSFGMRPPEALLEAPQTSSADIWTLGCLLYELITGETLFDPTFQTVELGFTPEESHLIQIIELLGQFPRDSLKAGKNAQKWFYDDGSLRLDTTYYHVSLKDVLEMRIEGPEVVPTSEFLGAMLRSNPHERARADELVNHPWFDNLDT